MNKYQRALDQVIVEDGQKYSLRKYLRQILVNVWEEGEGFSGKRPMGNSDWYYSVYNGLVKEGFIKGEIDSDGYLDDVDADAGNKFINNVIMEIFK